VDKATLNHGFLAAPEAGSRATAPTGGPRPERNRPSEPGSATLPPA